MQHFTATEILMHRIAESDLTPQQTENLKTLLDRVNCLFEAYTGPLIVVSGYRSPEINAATANSGKNSWHLQCAAVDIQDIDGAIWAYCMQNLDLCADLGLWLEDKRWTPTWTHLQIYPPASGKRVLVPNKKPAQAPHAWNGLYDSKLDSKIIK